MRRIAIPTLAVLYAVTAWSHGFKDHGVSQIGPLGSEQAAAHIAPVPLSDLPGLVLISAEEN